MQVYRLDDIVSEYLTENGLPENRRERIYTIATSGLRELSMDITAIPKSKELLVSENDTVDLPLGFLNYLSINLIGADGMLYGLGRNKHIDMAQHFNKCGQQTRRVDSTNNANFIGYTNQILANPNNIAEHYRNGENTGAYFNAGGRNTVGQYRIDYTTNRIYLIGLRVRATSIVLEYISDIEAENDDFVVHPFIINTLKTWINWKLNKSDEMAYKRARKESVGRFNTRTLQEWMDSIRGGTLGVAKF